MTPQFLSRKFGTLIKSKYPINLAYLLGRKAGSSCSIRISAVVTAEAVNPLRGAIVA